MIVSKEVLAKIKNIIERNYNNLTISLLGNTVLDPETLQALNDFGIDTNNPNSFLELVYYHNLLNENTDANIPKDIPNMLKQQSIPNIKPLGDAPRYTLEHLNENTKQSIDKLKQQVQASIEGVVRNYNLQYKNDALQNLNRPENLDQIIKDSLLQNLKQTLRDTTKDANRDWQRIARTEISNAIGMGSADRIVMDNKDKPSDTVYVYRIVADTSARLCKYCREFYLDSDGTPKVYRLSDLLSNGSNYGKKADQWKPVSVATHPNERCSMILELRPGWKVNPGGKVSYIGLEAWEKYIIEKVQK